MFSHQEITAYALVSDLTVHSLLGSVSSMISKLSSEVCHEGCQKSRTGLSLHHCTALYDGTAQISIDLHLEMLFTTLHSAENDVAFEELMYKSYI